MKYETQEFLRAIWGKGKASYWWTGQDRRSHWFNVGGVWRNVPDHHEYDVYFGVNPCRFIPFRPSISRTRLLSLVEINVVYCDIDDTELDESALPTAPSAIIKSGNGHHCYWLLDKPITLKHESELQYAKHVQRWWVHNIPQADRGVCCLTRILRLPGTYNHKDPSLLKPVEFLHCDLGLRYSIKQLGIPDMPEEAEYVNIEIPRVNTGNEAQRLTQICYDNLAHAPRGDRNKQCYSQSYFMGRLIGAGLIDHSQGLQLLRDAAMTNGVGVDRPEDTARSIKRGVAEGIKEPFDVTQRRKRTSKPNWDEW